ncbi:hypothetical protein TNCV_584871 [Trichonephila clavipes]|nr:hypothetical protein TNCV_584871 [Trichonephila clavipes]
MIVYGIRPRHGQRSSHNNEVLPLLPVDMHLKSPVFWKIYTGIFDHKTIRNMIFQDKVETETRPLLGVKPLARVQLAHALKVTGPQPPGR